MSPQLERDRESLAETGRVWQRHRVWLEVRESLAETETQSLAEAEKAWQRQRLRESGRDRDADKMTMMMS